MLLPGLVYALNISPSLIPRFRCRSRCRLPVEIFYESYRLPLRLAYNIEMSFAGFFSSDGGIIFLLWLTKNCENIIVLRLEKTG